MGYEIYWSYCGKNTTFKKLTTVKTSKLLKYTVKNLKGGKPSKYFIVAYKLVDGKKVYISKSLHIHVVPKGAKYTNAKNIKIKRKEIALKENCYKMMLLTGSKEKATLDFYSRAGYNSSDKTAFITWL